MWNYCHPMPMLSLLEANHCLPLFHVLFVGVNGEMNAWITVYWRFVSVYSLSHNIPYTLKRKPGFQSFPFNFCQIAPT